MERLLSVQPKRVMTGTTDITDQERDTLHLVLDVAQSVGNAAGGGETTESEAIAKIRSTPEAGATA
jgi:hypothetical protein